jgi:hypothetical protein
MLRTGLDGCVVLSPRECETFAPLLRQAIDQCVRRDGVHFPSEVIATSDWGGVVAQVCRGT